MFLKQVRYNGCVVHFIIIDIINIFMITILKVGGRARVGQLY